MRKLLKARIIGFYGRPLSGIGYLTVVDAAGVESHIPCENLATVRALESAFGNVVEFGYTVNPKGGHVGQEVYISFDDTGTILSTFVPVSILTDEQIARIEAYNSKL